MTHDDRSLERAARSWIEDGPRRAPDHVVDAALRSIATTSQERDWLPRRFPTMTIPARLGVAAVVGVLLVGGVALTANRPSAPSIGANPTLTPTAAPTASPSPSLLNDHSDYAGRLLVQPRSSGALQRSIVGHARRPSRACGSAAAVRAVRRPAVA